MNDSLDKVFEQCRQCQKCELYKSRNNVVFGDGNPHAKILFVGEAPGEQEDLKGIPFVGRAGQLLDKYLFAVDLDRKDVYIANILKCRPPHNRDPLPAEEDTCIDYLRNQVNLIQPKLIVCLGRISAKRLIKPDFQMMKEHGKWFKKGNYLLTAVYHPAAILRNPNLKEDMLLDMQQIKKYADEIDP